MVSGWINANPVVYEKKERQVSNRAILSDEYAVEPIDQQEVFDILFFVQVIATSLFCIVFGYPNIKVPFACIFSIELCGRSYFDFS